ncbi:hypothetical protein RHMOL_Rhmol01G0153200 [Rhododendron molle]|uniref:Uncharacterized protein n=1 Tax=Rhododendron molle TaxID=49168 RepID=A0ACC0Q3M6_RHOML|nr:hypothetical protein RHMOL_Rhmol01G0153200 [Rhododendron molle]
MRSGYAKRLPRRVCIALQLQSCFLIGRSESLITYIKGPLGSEIKETKHIKIHILSHPLKPRNSAEILSQTLPSKVLTFRRQPSINPTIKPRSSNPNPRLFKGANKLITIDPKQSSN